MYSMPQKKSPSQLLRRTFPIYMDAVAGYLFIIYTTIEKVKDYRGHVKKS